MCKRMARGLRIYSFMTDMGYRGLSKEEALAMCSHFVDAFIEWIERSAGFHMVLLLLEVGQQHATVMQEK